ncbi:5'-nucleotidase C-terminal domain-containing protein [Alloiococcus otitis]|uniref:LPXTG-domain-containing protein cell wall anchor domain n=1 Tax=Alloiococcus otitis ATCC 51267 TaxID=883081 RepID=K9ESE7_9LACT|nr:5'-nucleotidase C-terminal domain-containing protein [Alloiococcus otitis]EKU93857.1 hypothetical protein HMPREF9698_00652 [Alloiococcus otitis ATCC 51267]
MKQQNEGVHRKVLRKVKKHFVAVTLSGLVLAGISAQDVQAQEGQASDGSNLGQGLASDQTPEGSDDEVLANLSQAQADDQAQGVLNAPASDEGEVTDDQVTASPAESGQALANPEPDQGVSDQEPGQAADRGQEVSDQDQASQGQADDQGQEAASNPVAEGESSEGETEETPSQDQTADSDADQGQDQESPVQAEASPEVSLDHAPNLKLPPVPERPAGTRRATIGFTNDLHGRITRQGESDYDMGLGHIKTIFDAYRQLADEFLLLDAGDTVHGTTLVNLTEGENIIRLMNEMGYHAMTTGNHEYNYGFDRLKELEEEADFEFVASNVKDTEGNDLFKSFTEWEVFGEKIGIIGLATQGTYTSTHPNNVEGIVFTDEVQAISDQIEALSEEFSKFIVLSHVGYGVDQEIARQNPEVELIIGGHSHTPVIGGAYVDGNDKTLITQAWEHGKLIGLVHLDFDENGNIVQKTAQHLTLAENLDQILEDLPSSTVGNPEDILAVEGSEEDPVIKEMLEEIQAEVERELGEVIGSTSVVLNGERDFVRRGETNLGNLITDAVREFTGAEIAFINGGGIRASIDAGEITLGDVVSVLPFINLVETVNVPGSVILEALEHGSRQYPEQNGGFLHASGLKYIVDATREPGQRVVYVEVNGEVLDPDRTYNLATNDFLLAGGDGYTMFADYDVELVTGELFSDVLINYIRQQDGPIAPETEGRITVSDEALDADSLARLVAEITDRDDLEGQIPDESETDPDGEVESPDEDGQTPGDDQEVEDPEEDGQKPGDDSQTSDDDLTPVPADPQEDDQVVVPADYERAAKALDQVLAEIEKAFGPDFVASLLANASLEELAELADRYQAGQVTAEDLSQVAETSQKAGQTLPDTATAGWLLGALGLLSLSGGLVLTKKD